MTEKLALNKIFSNMIHYFFVTLIPNQSVYLKCQLHRLKIAVLISAMERYVQKSLLKLFLLFPFWVNRLIGFMAQWPTSRYCLLVFVQNLTVPNNRPSTIMHFEKKKPFLLNKEYHFIGPKKGNFSGVASGHAE